MHQRPTPPQFLPKDLNLSEEILDRFHILAYDMVDKNFQALKPHLGHWPLRSYFSHWMGYEILKWPTDLWTYQELIVKKRPDIIVETGTHTGGSALFLASICDLIDNGKIITIDIAAHDGRPAHPRITYLHGSSTAPAIFAETKALVAGRTNVMVILDGDHARDTVLTELRSYSQFVPPGGYIVAEDTNINGHPAYPDFGPGPWEAVEQFIAENNEFHINRSCERSLLTMNPNGFLQRKEKS